MRKSPHGNWPSRNSHVLPTKTIVRVTVNVSPVQFMVGELPETAWATLQRHDVPPVYLQRFPFHGIRIDQGFVRRMIEDP